MYTPPVLLGDPDAPKGLLLVPGTNGGGNFGLRTAFVRKEAACNATGIDADGKTLS